MRVMTTLLLALSLSLLAMQATTIAQTATTGTIEGTVTDINDAVVPGVTVTVTSPNLIRAQSATTDDEGRFRILNLPPGKYSVSIESAKGFAKFEQADVEVNLSRTSSVAVKLQAEGAAATVDVTTSAGATVDTASNTTGSNVSTDQFSNFPTQRTVQSLYTIAPTVARSGLRDSAGRDRDPSVAGSSGPENNYILDGVNTTDPAYGGSGANLPFEFIQEVEIKTGAIGAEYGKATGGIFNVITKSGGNEFRGDAFAYFSTKSLVRATKNFTNTGASPNGFSELDAGFDIGGPVLKDKLWFFGALNPQRRKNYFLTQTFRQAAQNEVSTPFYAGKLTWAANQNHVFTFSTFGDFSKVEGFILGPIQGPGVVPTTGFGDNPDAFAGTLEAGGHNYAARLNSTITPTWIGEFNFGLHLQRANIIPLDTGRNTPFINNNFAILRANGTVAPTTQSGVNFGGTTGFVDYVYSPGGSLQRNYQTGPGFGQFTAQDRNRWEFAARLQNIFGRHTFKYGFEYVRNDYSINDRRSGENRTFPNPLGLLSEANDPTNSSTQGYQVTNNFAVCTTRTITGQLTVVCPSAAATGRVALIATAANGFPGGAITGAITTAEFSNNPFLVRLSTRIRDFELLGKSYTNTESFYFQDDYKLARNVQFNFGLRWDYQQAYGEGGVSYLKFNDFKDNLQPRLGLTWDFTGRGQGKLFVNFARYLETPIPLDVNIRAGSDGVQTDKNFNVDRLNAAAGSIILPGVRGNLAIGMTNLGSEPTPIDPDLKPQTVNEVTAGAEYEIAKDLALGFRGIYRTQGSVIEDGSFDDGATYFIFNPGESQTDRLAREPAPIGVGEGFGRARRYYRAVEFTATKRFSNNYQFIASYVYSSLIGNYEGLFRNDNGQSDPNITSLFDLVSLLNNSYGRLPNDRPHQLKFNGSYQTPWKLLVTGNFYAQSGIPFNQLIPHAVYGNNNGLGVPRGTAIVPADRPGGVSAGGSRTPTTFNLDLGAYYPIKLGENRQLRFQVDWFNVLNQQRAIKLDETFQITSGVTGVAPVANPFYGYGSIFQYPSSLRLGVKFQF
ncbi:MAG TPA: TonB-dependent receptor [Pyrinomonadaceae bacterium]|nr:TonB-dependent receptor [Pyrinomonadaceae bacterium]